MFKRVDEEDVKDFKGFGYKNKDGDIEGVLVDDVSVVEIVYEDGIAVREIYYEDIPNLIKALQAAYDYNKGIK